MWVRVRLAGACLAGTLLTALLSACAVVDPVDNRYDTVARSLAKARNEQIFVNLVRASHDYPLSFVVISNVTPTMTNISTFGLPSFLFGPPAGFGTAAGAIASLPTTSPGRDVIFGNTTASNSTAIGTNFNVSTQETSAFYQGFLRPIDLQTLDYFIRQGYPRELLFWLFTDAFALDYHGHKVGYHYAPPDDYGCSKEDPKHRCFVDWVRNATLAGLTVEEKTLRKSASSGPTQGGESSASAAKTSTTIFARFCFNEVLARQAQALVTPAEVQKATHELDVGPHELFGSDQTCGSPLWHPEEKQDQPQSDILPLAFPRSNLTFAIVPRSAYGVFEFLGTLMKIKRQQLMAAKQDGAEVQVSPAYIPPNRTYALERPTLITVHEDPELLQVMQNLGGDCFVHTWFSDGEYCVPEQAATTKRIFALLAQLIAIQTAAGDLSITPIVRVIQ
ncbi:MAG: hypothetical protein ABSE67_21600 [Xanthobacteraceae bacterium]|jgi:hypothetical protein